MHARFQKLLPISLAMLATWMGTGIPLPTHGQGLKEMNPPRAPAEHGVIALTGGILVHGRDDQAVEQAVVLIQGGSILAAGSADDIKIPPEAVVKDVRGMSILPGLIDSHLHTVNDLDTPALFLAHGVTSFRDPGHPLRFYQALLQTDDVMPRAFMLKFVGMCHASGAKLVVGSHTHAPHAERGWAYQRELELLVEAGLSPSEAIQAGTRVNAEFFGAADRLGTIEPGKLADLVLVRGDATRDIRATYDVRHVMLNGNWVGESP